MSMSSSRSRYLLEQERAKNEEAALRQAQAAAKFEAEAAKIEAKLEATRAAEAETQRRDKLIDNKRRSEQFFREKAVSPFFDFGGEGCQYFVVAKIGAIPF